CILRSRPRTPPRPTPFPYTTLFRSKNNLPPHVSRPTPPKPHLPQSPYLKTIRFGILDCQGCTSCAEYTRLALDNRIHAGFFPYGGLGNTAIRAYKTPVLYIFRFWPLSEERRVGKECR